MPARGAVAVRVAADRRLGRVTVLALSDRGSRATPVATASALAEQPAVISRAGWGADESLRFDAGGTERWPRAFYPTQKLVVHHTAGRNDDPDPAATIRSTPPSARATSFRDASGAARGGRRTAFGVERPARYHRSRAPTALTAVGQPKSVLLDRADAAAGDGVTSYRVYRHASSGWPASPRATVTASSFRDTGLKPRTAYTYCVTAVDAAGNESAPSAQVTATATRWTGWIPGSRRGSARIEHEPADPG